MSWRYEKHLSATRPSGLCEPGGYLRGIYLGKRLRKIKHSVSQWSEKKLVRDLPRQGIN